MNDARRVDLIEALRQLRERLDPERRAMLDRERPYLIQRAKVQIIQGAKGKPRCQNCRKKNKWPKVQPEADSETLKGSFDR
jgi:hypothetical protein